jgi:hypothetical protein
MCHRYEPTVLGVEAKSLNRERAINQQRRVNPSAYFRNHTEPIHHHLALPRF